MALKGDTTGLDEFIYAGKPILPAQDSYSVRMPYGAVNSNAPGGLTKSQLQFFNQPYIVDCTYDALDAFKIDYIEGFLKRNAGQKFIAYLAISNSIIEPFVVQYLEQPRVSKTGFNGSVSISFEVEPAVDRCYEDFIADFAPCMGNPITVFCIINEGVRNLP